MSLTVRVLIGLVAGFLAGLALAGVPSPVAGAIVAVAVPVGTLFINLIRMTVTPLVVSMLVASVGSMAAAGALGRLVARAAAIAVTLLVVVTIGSLALAQPVLSRIPIDQAAALALRGGAATPGTGPAPTLAQWLIDLVSPNLFKALADGTMLPVIVFAVLFGVALSRVPQERREPVLRVVQGVADAMQRLVSGILELAPVGVFALAVPLATTLGLAAAGAVIVYIVLVIVLTVIAGALLLYPMAVLGGPMPVRTFAAFCAPAQAVAFASRSSLASLPAMVECAEREGLPPVISAFVLPLGGSVFRVGSAVAQAVGVLFLAQLYGVALGPAQLASVAFAVVLTSFAVPGIPGGSIISMVPVLAAVNLPIEGIGILLAVDTIPDMFRTVANVTGNMALAAALRRRV